jgi:hypothetical protein
VNYNKKQDLFSGKKASDAGHQLDVEFAEERADREDWEALERSERADARQEKKIPKM